MAEQLDIIHDGVTASETPTADATTPPAEIATPILQPDARLEPAAEPEPDPFAYEEDPSAAVYTQLAEVQRYNQEMAKRLEAIQAESAKMAEERQDADLISRRHQLRQQMLAAIDAGDERARTTAGWELQDVETQLMGRQRQRELAGLRQGKEQQRPTETAPVNVWEAFRAANRITDDEFRVMYSGLQKMRAARPDIQETPSLYVHLLRQARHPGSGKVTKAPAGMPKPAVSMVEGSGDKGVSKAAPVSKHSKADLERMSEVFGGKLSADFFANASRKDS